jgi:hypothetical protein
MTMARLRKCLWMVAAITALPASAAAKDICATLTDFAVASRERPPFDSVRAALARGEAIVPGFEARDCRTDPRGISCDDISFHASNFDAWPEPLNCTGAIPAPVFDRAPRRRERQHAYLLSGLRIEYGFSCWGCAGGPHAFFTLAFQGRIRAVQ